MMTRITESDAIEEAELAEAQATERAMAAPVAAGGNLVTRATTFARAHWKVIGLAAVGLLAMRNKRLRPLVASALAAHGPSLVRRVLDRSSAPA